MARFFIDKIDGKTHLITGADAAHIVKSLRMRVLEELTLCDNNQTEYRAAIEQISEQGVLVKVISSCACDNEPSVFVTLYQGVPKSDKMDWIVQKSVELGASKICPILLSRCVARPDQKSQHKKRQRLQKIAEEAAKQSRRGIIPQIEEYLTLNQALERSKKDDCSLVFYENGGKQIRQLLPQGVKTVSIFVGPEGGFEREEVEAIERAGGQSATLGPRILRTETAPLAALSVIMELTANL